MDDLTPEEVDMIERSRKAPDVNDNKPVDDGVPMIVHRTQFVDSAGNVGTKEHGPMPVSEWADYEKKNNL